MATEEEEVKAAAHRFYDALEQIIAGRGPEAMEMAWHHTQRVSTAHPIGDWSHGWEEGGAAWKVIADSGKAENPGTRVRDVRAHVRGDMAYVTCVFIASPAFGSIEMNTTDVLEKIGGSWKVVHHHADKAPKVEETFNKLA